jgi:uncharacterized protein
MPKTLDRNDLVDLAFGAAFLGAGGGGNPYLGRLMAQQCLDEGLSIRLLDPDELDDDALVIPTAMMGAPTVLVEKLPSGEEAIHSLQTLEGCLGRRAVATMSIEIGGINSTIPLVVGARLGLPVVDADGMGRAFPQLEMETFGVYGISAAPMAVSNEYGEACVIRSEDNRKVEWLARGVTIRMGGCAYIAEYAMSGADVKRTAIPRTLTLAIRIGRCLREAKDRHKDPIEALLELLPQTIYSYGRVIFKGKIVDLSRETRRGFSLGRIRIAGSGAHAGDMTIEIQNENLIARVGDEVRAIVPDLICVMDSESAEPITTELLRYGQRVTIVAVSVPQIMRTPAALEVFGPKAFGLSEPFQSITALEPA